MDSPPPTRVFVDIGGPVDEAVDAIARLLTGDR